MSRPDMVFREHIPKEPPSDPEKWEQILQDIRNIIMPGLSQQTHPHFFGFFPPSRSFASTLADLLDTGLGIIQGDWVVSPATTELERIMVDWLATMLSLPEHFKFSSGGNGGGIIYGSGSESVMMAMYAARTYALQKWKNKATSCQKVEENDAAILTKLVAYTSEEAHPCFERACLLGFVRIHKLKTDSIGSVGGETLRQAMQVDKNHGLIPYMVMATLGTTGSCSFDNISEIGPICRDHDVWFHVDAAYAGCACICPEFKHLMSGIEFADSLNVNPWKFLCVNMDCSVMWYKDSRHVQSSLSEEDPLYLADNFNEKYPEYRRWQIHLCTRFRSLKLWFVIRLYGVNGLQEHIRMKVKLAKEFERYLSEDERFQVTNQVTLGLVCFRLKGKDNSVTVTLLDKIKKDGRVFMVPSSSNGIFYIRLAVGPTSELKDIKYAWKVISELTNQILI